MGNINQQLNELYERELAGGAMDNKKSENGLCPFNDSFAGFGVEGLSSPFLIKFADEQSYENDGNLKVMFFMQETGGWVSGEMDSILDTYRDFFNDFDLYEPNEPMPKHCWQRHKHVQGGGVTWRILEEFKNLVDTKLAGVNVRYVWNNIVKAEFWPKSVETKYPGSKGYKVPLSVYTRFKEANRKLIIGELDIIKPDVIVFFTGPKYYWHIDTIFGDGEKVPKDNIGLNGKPNALRLAHLPMYGDALITYHPFGLDSQSVRVPALTAIVENVSEAARKKGLI
ncbi:hypothetical protein FACS189490_09510 [Clostridia bacterium]|nr:hypothetical protein FACS189490_09510 [Clostridia bacterium]